MNDELNITQRVMTAQKDVDEADRLIREYLPFIKSETAKTIGRIPVEGQDDELSIALMGFHEAIESYNHDKGAFFSFAALVINRRIVDFLRHENRFKQHVSLDESSIDCGKGGVKQDSGSNDLEDREALKWEIQKYIEDLKEFDITISEVAANCPKQEKTIEDSRRVVSYMISDQECMDYLSKTKKLPVTEIIRGTSVKKKTLERHRKYLIALTIIYFRGYDCMIDHLTEIFKSQKGGK